MTPRPLQVPNFSTASFATSHIEVERARRENQANRPERELTV